MRWYEIGMGGLGDGMRSYQLVWDDIVCFVKVWDCNGMRWLRDGQGMVWDGMRWYWMEWEGMEWYGLL